jgi:CBS domain-containing protein
VLTRKGMDVWGISPDATVFEAIALMDQKRVGALVVLSGAELAGINFRTRLCAEGDSEGPLL